MKRQLKNANSVMMVMPAARAMYVTNPVTVANKILTNNGNQEKIALMTAGDIVFSNGDPNSPLYNTVYNSTSIQTAANFTKRLEIFTKTGYTTMKYPLKNIPYFSSVLDATFPIEVSLERYKDPTKSLWGFTIGASQVIEANTTYELNFKFGGRTMDEAYSTEGLIYTANVLTPDWASNLTPTMGLAAYQAHYLYHMLGMEINASSPLNFPTYRGRVPMLALGIGLTGHSGSASYPLISGLAAGTDYTIWISARGNKTVQFTAEEIATLQTMIAGMPFTTPRLIPLNAAKANDTTLAATDKLVGLAFIALDRETQFEDFVAQVQTNINNVGVSKGFNASQVTVTRLSKASEQNSSRALYLQYRNTFSQRLYNKLFDERANINYPNPVSLSAKYAVLTIEHTDQYSSDLGHVSIDPFVTKILFEETGTYSGNSGSTTGLATDQILVCTTITNFLAANNLPPIKFL